MKHINLIYNERLEAVSRVLAQLCTMHIAIHEIDLNRATPVITVQATGAVKQLAGVMYLRRGTGAGRRCRMQAQLGGYRVEWEIAA